MDSTFDLKNTLGDTGTHPFIEEAVKEVMMKHPNTVNDFAKINNATITKLTRKIKDKKPPDDKIAESVALAKKLHEQEIALEAARVKAEERERAAELKKPKEGEGGEQPNQPAANGAAVQEQPAVQPKQPNQPEGEQPNQPAANGAAVQEQPAVQPKQPNQPGGEQPNQPAANGAANQGGRNRRTKKTNYYRKRRRSRRGRSRRSRSRRSRSRRRRSRRN